MTDHDETPHVPGSAPMIELRLARTLRIYERVKLGLMLAVLVLDILIGLYLINIARDNRKVLGGTKQSLVILECAINKDTYQSPAGKPLTQQESRAALDACIARGGPAVTK